MDTKRAKSQPMLFSVDVDDRVRLEDAALELGVSNATIRNWIKTKYLLVDDAGLILRTSIVDFQSSVAGVEKLNKRANKSLVDSHDHAELRTSVAAAILTANLTQCTSLSRRYEESLSDSYRNKEGVYYTPQEIVREFFAYLPDDVSQLKFCDPCCGSGNFLVAALERGFLAENVFGFDIDPTAIDIAAQRTGLGPNNLIIADFLEVACRHNMGSEQPLFDVIFTNPPWGKKLTKLEKDRQAVVLGAGRSSDSSALFFFASLRLLRLSGYLGFLLPEAFFSIATFQDAREKALQYQILGLSDFGRPFKALLTKAKGIVLRHEAPTPDKSVECKVAGKIHALRQSHFSANPKAIFNFSVSESEASVISHVLRKPHITLASNARWGLGIVTGNNARFIAGQPRPNYVPVFRGSDIFVDRINTPTAYIPEDLSLYQQVAPLELYHAKEKLLYRFISAELVFFCDTEQRLVLNSANMLVLNNDFPVPGHVLARYLSSKIINWLFKTLFQTHKVLRSDLEYLPIFTEYLLDNPVFCESSLLNYLGIESDRNGSFRVKE